MLASRVLLSRLQNELPSEFKNTILGNDTVTLTLTPRPKALDFQSHTDASMRLMRCKVLYLFRN
jgi:hypothetical protein